MSKQKKIWQPVIHNGRKSAYRENDKGDCVVYVKNKKTRITLKEVTIEDVQFISNVSLSVNMKKHGWNVYNAFQTNAQYHQQIEQINKEKIMELLTNKEEDEPNLLLIAEIKGKQIGVIELVAWEEESSYVSCQLHFLKSSYKEEYENLVKTSIEDMCEEYGMYDFVYIITSDSQPVEVIYIHPDTEKILREEGILKNFES